MNYLKVILIFLFPFLILSQTFDRDTNPFSVKINGVELSVPFLGGFNRPIPQFVDWNNDGLADLFLSDEDGRIRYFQNEGTPGQPYFILKTMKFKNLNTGKWFRFFDYDNDDDLDLLGQTPGSASISVYQNVDGEFVNLTMELLSQDGYPVDGGQVVVPGIADIDGDGWQDLFVGTISGTVVFYKNLGIQNDMPLFHLETETFEDILIVWVPGKNKRHGANALEFFDIDADGDNDLFWGDLYQPGLFYLENFGTPYDPVIIDSLMIDYYPENDPVSTAGFNVPRLVDLDNDGDGDLVVGVLSGVYGTDFNDNFWLYENSGTESNPVFYFQTKNFFNTLDFISGSIPVEADIDADGDLDLFVGTEFDPTNPGWKGMVYYFENVGDTYMPIYSLADSNFFDLYIGNNLAPAFTDMDCDGDLDALVGDWNGMIHYFKNSGTSQIPTFDYIGLWMDIDLSGRSTPLFIDFDNDDDLDVFIGDNNGKVHVWTNSGNCNADGFINISEDYFPDMNLGTDIVLSSYDLDSDNDYDIIVGNEEGELFFIRNLDNSQWELESISAFPFSGFHIAPSFCNLIDNDRIELIVGSQSGGLQFFAVNMNDAGLQMIDIPERFYLLKNYPNPFNSTTTIEIRSSSQERDIKFIIYDLMGHKVDILKGKWYGDHIYKAYWDASEYPSGVYFVKAYQDEPFIRTRILNGKLLHLK